MALIPLIGYVGKTPVSVQYIRCEVPGARALILYQNPLFSTSLLRFYCSGGLLASSNTTVAVIGCSIYGNNCTASGDFMFGGGIAAVWRANVVLDRNSSVCNNRAAFGGGLSALHNASMTLTGGTNVFNNTAVLGGGGISVGVRYDHLDRADMPWFLSKPVVTAVMLTGGSSVHNNSATSRLGGAGMDVMWGGFATLTGGSSVHSNGSRGPGGGLHCLMVHVSPSATTAP